jgi:hypothetical protein
MKLSFSQKISFLSFAHKGLVGSAQTIQVGFTIFRLFVAGVFTKKLFTVVINAVVL